MGKKLKIGDGLRRAREKKEYSLQDVEKLTKLHFTTIAGYERDERQPSLSNLKLLCDLYGVTPNYILGYDVSWIETLSPEVQELIKNNDNIPYLVLADWVKKQNIDPEALKASLEILMRDGFERRSSRVELLSKLSENNPRKAEGK